MWYKILLAGISADPSQNAQQRLDNILVNQKHQIDTDGGGEEKLGPATEAQQARLTSQDTPAPWMTPFNAQLEAVRHENVNNPLSPREWTPELQAKLDALNNDYGAGDMAHQNMQGTETGGVAEKGGGPAFQQGKSDKAFSQEPASVESW